MGSSSFVVFLVLLILAICSMGWISKKLMASIAAAAAWSRTLFRHPIRALNILWTGFWASWTPPITVAVILLPFIFDAQLLGYAATKVLLFVAMALIFIRTCVAEEIHGKRENRREWGTRAWAVIIVFIILSGVSFFTCGALENQKRGKDATVANIWAASLWWRRSDTETPKAGGNPRILSPDRDHSIKPRSSSRTLQHYIEQKPWSKTDSVIPKEQTARYQAIGLDKEITNFLQSQRPLFSGGPDSGLEAYTAEMNRQVSGRYGSRLIGLATKLKACGADTKQLDGYVTNIMGHKAGPSELYGVAMQLSEAAYDIPGGQPECGTKAATSTGFREKDTGMYTVAIGRESMGFREDELTNGPHSLGTWYGVDLFQAYLLNGHFYVDTTLYLGFMRPAITIKRNEVATEDAFSIDHNFTDKAIEVVDRNSGVPIFQMIFETDRQVTIYGAFFNPKGKSVIIITPTGNDKVDLDPTGEKKITVKLKPLFKYPSWKHRGEYAEP